MRPVWIRSRIIELNDANLDRLPEYDYSEKGITYEVYGIPENQPTVDAIPVEWIKDYVDFGVSDELAQRYRRFVLNMLKDWEKENEKEID